MTTSGNTLVPRFRRHLRAEIGATGVFLFSEDGVSALQGAPVAELAAMLDGRTDLAAVQAACPGGLAPEQVSGMLRQLVDAGLVEYGTPAAADVDERALAWWDACGVDYTTAAPTGPVSLTVLGDAMDPGFVRAALAGAGLTVCPDPGGSAGPSNAELGVVLTEDYLDPRLAGIDAAHRASGRPWLLTKAVGTRVWIGPVFRPGGACWHCLADRLRIHRRAELVVQRVLGHDEPARRPPSSVPPLAGAVAHLVALEATKWLGGERYAGQEAVWVLDSHDLSGERHPLAPRPQCPACGDPNVVAEQVARPFRLRSAPKVDGSGGGDRARTPAETLAEFGHLVSPVTGIVKRVVPDPRAPGFAHAYRSGANLARSTDGLTALRAGVRAVNGGKGLCAQDAEVGALCEAVERYSGTWQGDERRVRGSLRSLGRPAVDPRTCLLFDDRQFAGRADWNPRHSAFNQVPPPFDPEVELDWTPLWSLADGRRRLLPTAMLYYGAPGPASLYADSNGCAAGTCREDAVLQGLLELVERDAVAIWWYNRLRVGAVDLGGLGDPLLAAQVTHHAGIGRELWVLDVTSDLGVPTMAAVSRRYGQRDERILLGFGAHLDPAVAARRAVTELNQSLSTDASASGPADDPDWHRWITTATLANQPYLRPHPAVASPARPFPRQPDLREDVEQLVERLAERGYDVLVLDQTRPDVGLPVVKVVVPGLRSFWSRYGPGRLFDVPVRTGQLSRPTPHDQLNPLPLFM
ncbi:TOMM precursor leader peptide-binding protein [Pseudonocardia sp. TRM90224]|uniref:TOMM precursor leader peptide-binding protein n=1 Tax=Pseudonocardia sp. TRM90224 TaxID=2812678 RepID=UPI001E55EA6E|nr:TOMM precursor leader peptide-binding protein [Pseudonocardia sp. TRM90224]